MSQPLAIRLPMPPSINSAYANVPGRGRVATKALRSWKSAAGARLRKALAVIPQRPVFSGLVDVEIQLPVSWASDADNRIKAVPDLLKACGVITDDKARYVRSVRATWVYDGSLGDQIEVSVTQIADAPAQRPQGGRTAAKAPSRLRVEPASATRQRRASEALSPKDAGICAEAATAGRAAAKRHGLVSAQRPDVSPALEAPRQRQKLPSPKASAPPSDTSVRNAIASRLGIDPGRVHLNHNGK
jgi:Holliday junction resolvase RusA-like endonuclease